MALCAEVRDIEDDGGLWIVETRRRRTKGGVWFAPLRDIAAHVRRCIADGSWTPRTEPPLRMPRAYDPQEDAAP